MTDPTSTWKLVQNSPPVDRSYWQCQTCKRLVILTAVTNPDKCTVRLLLCSCGGEFVDVTSNLWHIFFDRLVTYVCETCGLTFQHTGPVSSNRCPCGGTFVEKRSEGNV